MEVWYWGIAAAVLIGAELFTGTFYLLAVGAAAALGAVLAALRLSLEAQLLLASIACVAFVFIAHHWRVALANKSGPPMGLDVGQRVTVETWNADGSARVTYRGTTWDGVLAGPEVNREAPLFIAAMRGSTLVLSNQQPPLAN